MDCCVVMQVTSRVRNAVHPFESIIYTRISNESTGNGESASVWVTWEMKERRGQWKIEKKEEEWETKRQRSSRMLHPPSWVKVRPVLHSGICVHEVTKVELSHVWQRSFFPSDLYYHEQSCPCIWRERNFVSLLGGIKWHREQEKINRHSIKSHWEPLCDNELNLREVN